MPEALRVMLPKMLRIRQTFPRPRVADIPQAVAATLGAAGLRIARGDTVAVGAGSRGIANIATIVGATVKYLRDLGAKPFVARLDAALARSPSAEPSTRETARTAASRSATTS